MKRKISAFICAVLTCCALFSVASPASAVTYKNKVKLRSEAALVMFYEKSDYASADSQITLKENQIIYSVNADKKMYPASTTKIMTYIAVADNFGKKINGSKFGLKTQIPIKQEVLSILDGTGSSVANVEAHVGGKMTVLDLLYSMMVPSGNDAAVVLADYVGGGNIANFVKMMNDKAAQLGCTGTKFANPDGLHDKNHYTTASDLMKMTVYALGLPKFSEITDTATKYIMNDDYPLVTTNYLIDENRGGDYFYPYAKGIKTGTTDEAGHCLVTMGADDDSHRYYLAVLLNSPIKDPDEYGTMYDAADLFRWALTGFENDTVISAETPMGEVKVNEGNVDVVHLEPEESFHAVVPTDFKYDRDIEEVKNIPESVNAPVKKGDVIGSVTLYYKGKQAGSKQELGTVNLVATEDNNRNNVKAAGASCLNVLTGEFWFVALIVGIIALLLLYILITTFISKRDKKRRKNVKRYRNF